MGVPNRAQMMEIWRKRNPESNQSQATKITGNDYMSLVEAHMKETGESKAMAMRAVTAKYPEKHEAWICSVQK